MSNIILWKFGAEWVDEKKKKKFENHEPQASYLQVFREFPQHSKWIYYDFLFVRCLYNKKDAGLQGNMEFLF